MINYTEENIFDINVEALVNTVNCVGIMGKGLALQFKKYFPENFKAYQKSCREQKVQPGHIFVYETGTFNNPKYILNFPTKRHWKEKSRLEDIQIGLKDLIKKIKILRIKSIAIPPLGCGNGGLYWPTVHKLILEACEEIPNVKIKIIEPNGYKEQSRHLITKPKLTLSRALVIKLIERYQELHYQLTLIEIQKLAYFLQEAGEPLKLTFEKAHYGPFANNLNKVLSRMEGHFIKGFDIENPKPHQEITLIDSAKEEVNALLNNDAIARHRLKVVENLIEGFESPYGLELLATVHWVVHHGNPRAHNLFEAIELTHNWNLSKKNKFSPEHIETTWSHLKEVNWI